MLTNRRVYADRQEFVHRESELVFLWLETMVQSRSFTAPHILCIHTLLLHKETKISLSTRQIDKQTDWLQTCTFSRDFFPPISGYCFSKLPEATVQHLRSPRPIAWLLIATLHLCHMNSWWDSSSVCILESISTQVKMLGLPRSSQKPLVFVRICLAAVPWHSGKCVCLCVCARAHVSVREG